MGNTQVIDGIVFFTFLNEASVFSAFFSRSFCGSKCIPCRPPFRSCRHLTWFRRAKSGRSPVRTPSLSRGGGGCVTLRCQVQRELAEGNLPKILAWIWRNTENGLIKSIVKLSGTFTFFLKKSQPNVTKSHTAQTTAASVSLRRRRERRENEEVRILLLLRFVCGANLPPPSVVMQE